MNKTTITLGLALICFFNVAAILQSFNFVSPQNFKQWLESDKPIIIVDIQEKKAFSKQHFKGSIETNAYPMKTDAEKKSIDPAVEQYKSTGLDVVVICPRGGGGAKRTYNYLKLQGVPEEKLFILKGGIEKWPHREMLVGR